MVSSCGKDIKGTDLRVRHVAEICGAKQELYERKNHTNLVNVYPKLSWDDIYQQCWGAGGTLL